MFWCTISLYIFTSSAKYKERVKYTAILYTKTSYKLFITTAFEKEIPEKESYKETFKCREPK